MTSPQGIITSSIVAFKASHYPIASAQDYSMHTQKLITSSQETMTSLNASFNATAIDEISPWQSTAYHWHALPLSLIMMAGIMGNVLVCMAVVSEKKLQNVTNYFLMSLAIADLFVCCVVMPLSLMFDFLDVWPLGLAMCTMWQASDVMMSTSSIMHMCVISLDRYLTMRSPLSTRHRSRTGVTLKMAAVWIISLATASPIVILSLLRPEDILNSDLQCGIFNSYFVISGSLTVFFIPLCIMSVTYTLTISLLNKQAKQCCRRGSDGMRRTRSRKKFFNKLPTPSKAMHKNQSEVLQLRAGSLVSMATRRSRSSNRNAASQHVTNAQGQSESGRHSRHLNGRRHNSGAKSPWSKQVLRNTALCELEPLQNDFTELPARKSSIFALNKAKDAQGISSLVEQLHGNRVKTRNMYHKEDNTMKYDEHVRVTSFHDKVPTPDNRITDKNKFSEVLGYENTHPNEDSYVSIVQMSHNNTHRSDTQPNHLEAANSPGNLASLRHNGSPLGKIASRNGLIRNRCLLTDNTIKDESKSSRPGVLCLNKTELLSSKGHLINGACPSGKMTSTMVAKTTTNNSNTSENTNEFIAPKNSHKTLKGTDLKETVEPFKGHELSGKHFCSPLSRIQCNNVKNHANKTTDIKGVIINTDPFKEGCMDNSEYKKSPRSNQRAKSCKTTPTKFYNLSSECECEPHKINTNKLNSDSNHKATPSDSNKSFRTDCHGFKFRSSNATDSDETGQNQFDAKKDPNRYNSTEIYQSTSPNRSSLSSNRSSLSPNRPSLSPNRSSVSPNRSSRRQGSSNAWNEISTGQQTTNRLNKTEKYDSCSNRFDAKDGYDTISLDRFREIEDYDKRIHSKLFDTTEGYDTPQGTNSFDTSDCYKCRTDGYDTSKGSNQFDTVENFDNTTYLNRLHGKDDYEISQTSSNRFHTSASRETTPAAASTTSRETTSRETTPASVHQLAPPVTRETTPEKDHQMGPKTPSFRDLVQKHQAAFKIAGMLIAKREQKNTVRTEQKAIKVLGIMFATFVICWTPFFTINFTLGIWTDCPIPIVLFKIFLWLGYFSSTLNPIIYTIFNKTFRTFFARKLTCGRHGTERTNSFSTVTKGSENYTEVDSPPVVSTFKSRVLERLRFRKGYSPAPNRNFCEEKLPNSALKESRI